MSFCAVSHVFSALLHHFPFFFTLNSLTYISFPYGTSLALFHSAYSAREQLGFVYFPFDLEAHKGGRGASGPRCPGAATCPLWNTRQGHEKQSYRWGARSSRREAAGRMRSQEPGLRGGEKMNLPSDEREEGTVCCSSERELTKANPTSQHRAASVAGETGGDAQKNLFFAAVLSPLSSFLWRFLFVLDGKY